MRLCLGITGHRETNAAYRDNTDKIESRLRELLTVIGKNAPSTQKPRLHALLSLGTDLQAVEIALSMGWQVAAPLPFGKELNVAINAQPTTIEDARALLDGDGSCSNDVNAAAERIAKASLRVTCFELAERDTEIKSLFFASLEDYSADAERTFSLAASERAALAGQVMIDQIDLLIAVWDGHSPGPVGGTRHTIMRALDTGVTVLWIDAGHPEHMRVLDNPEALANRWNAEQVDDASVIKINRSKTAPPDDAATGRNLIDNNAPPKRSRKRFHIYRRVEVLFAGELRNLFGTLTQRYPNEEDVIAADATLLGSAADLTNSDARLLQQAEQEVIRRFVRADAISTYLSDAYRGGMVANLALAAFAVIGGIAYLPMFEANIKWPFALFEFGLLALILFIIAIGRRHDWHGRWFQTRRVAEYLRHAPFMLFLGVARPAGSWPRSADAGWPEHYVRSILREIGLPETKIDQQTLRVALGNWIGKHVSAQRAYHVAKAERLERIHDNLEKFSERLFFIAMLVVATYLLAELSAWAGLVSTEVVRHSSKTFTFLGVALPTLGGALAGIHYFSDFGRFAAISESTASRLEAVERRIETLLAAPEAELDYGRVASISRAVDEIVVSEIEHWQDVFGGKHISVPV